MERVLEAKVVPPALPEHVLERPRVSALLSSALTRRLTSVVAPAGFGKSTLLAAWADQHRAAWYTCTEEDGELDTLFRGVVAALRHRVPRIVESIREVAPPGQTERGPDARSEDAVRAGAHAGHLARVLEDRLTSDLVLVIDDLHELPGGSAAARFVEALCRQAPRTLHLALLSRRDLPFPTARLRARGEAAEISGALLTFDLAETTELAARVCGPGRALAERLHATTLGWPAAVRLGTEALRERAALRRVAAGEFDPEDVIALLAEELFDSVEPALAGLVGTVAPLESVSPALCEALGVPDSTPLLTTLERRGLLTAQADGWYALHPLVRHWALHHLIDEDDAARVRDTAVRWLSDHGQVRPALRLLRPTANSDTLLTVLLDHGNDVLAEGGADELLRHLGNLDLNRVAPADRSRLTQLEGEARYAAGDWDGALFCLDRLGSGTVLPAGAAWRAGLIHHQRGDLTRALAVYARCAPAEDPPGPTADDAMVDALSAATHWLRGDFDTSRELAERAHAVAAALADDRALAAAHTALAMLAAVTGDRRANDAHYLRALTHAERASDVLQLARIHCNRGSRYLEESDYRDALTELDASIALADLAGYALVRGIALANRGQVLLRTGRLDEALRDLAAARTIFERTGAHMLVYPLTHLGDVHAARQETALAAATYDEAIRLATDSGDRQGLIPALCGLARLVVDIDPERAAALAGRAVAAGPGIGRPLALLTDGWTALAAGDAERALARAAEATAAARAHRDRSTLAQALELTATATADPAESRRLLQEAAASWHRLGHTLDEARMRVLLGAGPGATEDDRTAADAALEILRIAGARRDTGAFAERSPSEPSAAEVTVLGSFRLTVMGRRIRPGDWGSRKPRDLLKVLIGRRGPVRRDELLEILWPGEDPSRSGRKLSVALSTLRALLDPERRFPAEHFITADRDSVWLDRDQWDVDVERFVEAAEDGLRRVDRGDRSGLARLATAEALFRGDAFEEDAYEEWAQPLRDQVRELWVGLLRTLAEDALAETHHDRAVRLLLRLLERDPYDERAHQRLVQALLAGGRHGEARRVYRAYCERMDEIGVEPAPYPDPPRRR